MSSAVSMDSSEDKGNSDDTDSSTEEGERDVMSSGLLRQHNNEKWYSDEFRSELDLLSDPQLKGIPLAPQSGAEAGTAGLEGILVEEEGVHRGPPFDPYPEFHRSVSTSTSNSTTSGPISNIFLEASLQFLIVHQRLMNKCNSEIQRIESGGRVSRDQVLYFLKNLQGDLNMHNLGQSMQDIMSVKATKAKKRQAHPINMPPNYGICFHIT